MDAAGNATALEMHKKAVDNCKALDGDNMLKKGDEKEESYSITVTTLTVFIGV